MRSRPLPVAGWTEVGVTLLLWCDLIGQSLFPLSWVAGRPGNPRLRWCHRVSCSLSGSHRTEGGTLCQCALAATKAETWHVNRVCMCFDPLPHGNDPLPHWSDPLPVGVGFRLTTSVRRQSVSTGVRGSKADWKSQTLIALQFHNTKLNNTDFNWNTLTRRKRHSRCACRQTWCTCSDKRHRIVARLECQYSPQLTWPSRHALPVISDTPHTRCPIFYTQGKGKTSQALTDHTQHCTSVCSPDSVIWRAADHVISPVLQTRYSSPMPVQRTHKLTRWSPPHLKTSSTRHHTTLQ